MVVRLEKSFINAVYYNLRLNLYLPHAQMLNSCKSHDLHETIMEICKNLLWCCLCTQPKRSHLIHRVCFYRYSWHFCQGWVGTRLGIPRYLKMATVSVSLRTLKKILLYNLHTRMHKENIHILKKDCDCDLIPDSLSSEEKNRLFKNIYLHCVCSHGF